jgi:hypothetical protein
MSDISLAINEIEISSGNERIIYVKGGMFSEKDEESFLRFCFEYITKNKNDVKLHFDIDRGGSSLISSILQLRKKCEESNIGLQVTYPVGKRENYEALYTVGIDKVLSITEKDYNIA